MAAVDVEVERAMPVRHHSARRFVQEGLFDDLSSFAELEQRIIALGDDTTKAVGDAFEVFVEAYLATQPLFQCADCYPVGQVPMEIRRAENLPNDAKGIDGVFLTRNAGVVPYQIKFRSHRPAVTFDEVATFLGVTDRASDRLLITNSDRLAPDISKRDHLRTVRGSDFDNLTPEELRECLAWLRGQPFAHTRAVPRDDQAQAIRRILDTLPAQRRATVVMPCGTGKTLVQLWTAEALGAKRVLVLVPSLALIQQTLTEWSWHTSWGDRFRYLCVCSDPTVVQGAEDLLVVRQGDLGFTVDTDPAIVRDFLATADDTVRVVFSTYQSAKVVAEGLQGLPALDLGIFDEAHKTTGPRDGIFAFALTDANLPIRDRLFFTATPRHYLQTRDREGDFQVVSMDDEATYGSVAYAMSFAEAVQREIICDYRVVLSVIDPDEVTEYAIQHGITLVKGDLQATTWVATQIAVQRAVEDTDASKVITFHTRVTHAQIFASDTERGIRQYLPAFTVGHVNGMMSAADRRDILSGFRDTRPRLVTNARCLTEGVDLPAVDMVAFINPRKSKVDIVQAIGRAMRKPRDRDKTFGYIVVPVLLTRTEGQSLEAACQATDWADVLDVLAALRDSDTRLVDIVADLRFARGRSAVFNPRALHARVRIIGPFVDLAVVQRSIDSIIVERIGVSWDEMYGRLTAYKDTRGDCDVPQNYPDDPPLGRWCAAQRQLKKEGRLAPDRMVRLNALEFVLEPYDAWWDEMYERLVAYKAKHGHCNMPALYSADRQLGRWCVTQGQVKKRSMLSDERVAKLEALGFVWSQLDAEWDGMFERLQAFKAREGHVNVSVKYPGERRLGTWCQGQRGAKRQGRLQPERVAKLEALGFVWQQLDMEWNEMFGRLQAFKNREGHANVPVNYPADAALGRWLGFQRRRKKLGRLPPDRIATFEALGVVWERQTSVTRALSWGEMYARLQAFGKREGHANVPSTYLDGSPSLAGWCDRQRTTKKNGELSHGRITKLDALGFVWGPLDAVWEEMFRRLQAFKVREGHVNVPVGYAADLKLGTWCVFQRVRNKQGRLSTERTARLEALGFVWEVRDYDAVWNEMFGRLQAFKTREGHVSVPVGYRADRQLGRWCDTQRQYRKKKNKSLSPSRISKLDALGFVWKPYTTRRSQNSR